MNAILSSKAAKPQKCANNHEKNKNFLIAPSPNLLAVSLPSQGAKKLIFTACHSGKLKLAFTSPDFISTSPKSFLTSRIGFTVLLLFEFLKKTSLARWAS